MMRRVHAPNATLGWGELLHAVARPLDVTEAERSIERLTGAPHAVLFASARAAIAAAVASLAPGGRVALPAYTCVAAADAVLHAGAEPVYADVDERGIVPAGGWPDSDIVLVQDTYGFTAAFPQGRIAIRDAAHRADLLLNVTGSAVVSSFGVDKWLTAGGGGVTVTSDPQLADAMRRWRDVAPPPKGRLKALCATALRTLMGRLEYRGVAVPAFGVTSLRRLIEANRLREEQASELAPYLVSPSTLGRPDGSTARLVTTQLRRASTVAEHRAHVVGLYDRAAGISRPPEPLHRYPMTADDPPAVHARLRSAGWDVAGRTSPRTPMTNPAESRYRPGTAPYSELLSATTVELPTHPLVRDEDAARLIALALEGGARPVSLTREPGLVAPAR
jgi:dTDP-4-amino-4,6-dideoxygalactose transaminase